MFKTATIVVSTIACAQAASDPAEHVEVAHGEDGVQTASDSYVDGVEEKEANEHDIGQFKQNVAGQWGRSFDSVKAQSFTDEQYVRGIDADDDSWAVDYDKWETEEKASKAEGASSTEVKGGDEDEPVFNKPKGVSDIVNTQAVGAGGHYLDAFPALPTIPVNASAGYSSGNTGFGHAASAGVGTTGYGLSNTGYSQLATGLNAQ